MRLFGYIPDPLLVHCGNDLCLLEEVDSFSGEDLDASDIYYELSTRAWRSLWRRAAESARKARPARGC